MSAQPLRTLASAQRGGIAITTALMMPGVMALLALVVDTGFYTISKTRLQMAADAAAMSNLLMMQSSSFQSSTSTQAANLLAMARFETTAAATKLAGTIAVQSPVTYDSSAYKSVSVTVTATPISVLSQFIPGASPPNQTANSKAMIPAAPLSPCLLALGPGVTQTDTSGGTVGILLESSAQVTANDCIVWSNTTTPSNTVYSIQLLNSASITGTPNSTTSPTGTTTTQIGALGYINAPSGTTLTPANTPGQNQTTAKPDPYAGNTFVDPGTACGSVTASATPIASGAYTGGTVFCGTSGNSFIFTPGSGKTISFAAGIYYFVNGSATFNAGPGTLTFDQTSGVTFVFLGRGSTPIVGGLTWKAGAFTWLANTTATYGKGAKFAIMQVCSSGVTPAPIANSSGNVTISDVIYAPCGEIEVSGTASSFIRPTNGTLNIVAAAIHSKASSLSFAVGPPTPTGSTSTVASLVPYP